ncbi:MAG: OmpA family protein [Cyclobacteriaceae bacterium]
MNLITKADDAYEKFGYANALKYYHLANDVDDKDLYIIERIARCYIKLNDSQNGEVWLKEYIKRQDGVSQEIQLLLAEQLIQNEKYSDAEILLEQLVPTSLILKRLDGVRNFEKFKIASERYSVKALDFNSESGDFGPMYYEDGLAFVSARDKRKWVRNDYNWDGSAFLDFYYYNPNDSTKTISKISSLNSNYHEGPGHFYDYDRHFVFTRNNAASFRVKRSDEGISNLQIYFANRSKKGEEWGSIRKFEHCKPDFSIGHPTITSDGKLLIFASNMDGGYGGTDLYFSKALSDSTWSEPQNFGSQINTEAEELFPYLRGDLLFFASNGWPGLGGLDVFSIKFIDGVPKGNIENIGSPINSSKDDFGLIIDENYRTGYFATSRDGNDDLYSFQANFVNLTGRVLALNSLNPLDSVEMFLDHKINARVSVGLTNYQGKYSFESTFSDEVDLSAEKDGWVMATPIRLNMTEVVNGGNIEDMYMYRPKLQFVAKDSGDSSIIEDPIFEFSELANNQLVDPSGISYTVDAGRTYILKTSKHEYYAKRDTFFVAKNAPEISTRIIDLKKIVVGESIRLENIYYDLNSASLRQESEAELNKLLRFMNDNPDIVVELSSHTDSRGSAPYNKRLSQRRAESVTKYLRDNGVEKSRLVPKGYGESKLVNNCADGVKCDEERHQENRRTEIKILED